MSALDDPKNEETRRFPRVLAMERTGLEPVTSGLQNPLQPVKYGRVR